MENNGYQPLPRLDLNVPKFSANGKDYYIEQALTIERYCEFQLLEKELAFGMTFDAMLQKHKQLWKMLNKQEFVSAAVLIEAMVRGIAKLPEREPVVLKICSLFINEAGEDRTVWNQDIAMRKIEDWKKEGLVIQDFFGLALRLVNGLLDVYNQISQAISTNGNDNSVLSAIVQD